MTILIADDNRVHIHRAIGTPCELETEVQK